MIDVGVYGSKSARQCNELTEATMFYAYSLMPEVIANELEIEVHITSDIEHAGCAYPDDDDLNPRAFVIEINPAYTDTSIYSTLAHEMVHVKQWAMGEAYDLLIKAGEELVITRMWKGSKWSPDINEHAYFDCPWELEAFGREVGLYYRWKNRKKNA